MKPKPFVGYCLPYDYPEIKRTTMGVRVELFKKREHLSMIRVRVTPIPAKKTKKRRAK